MRPLSLSTMETRTLSVPKSTPATNAMPTFYKIGSMASGFDGFPQAGLDFFRKLKKNNKREWFQPRKQIFDESVKAPMIELIGAVNAQLARFAPDHIVE